jgi:hypothetical protein
MLHLPLLQLTHGPEHAVKLPDELLELLHRRGLSSPLRVTRLCGEPWVCEARRVRRFRWRSLVRIGAHLRLPHGVHQDICRPCGRRRVLGQASEGISDGRPRHRHRAGNRTLWTSGGI